MSVEFYEENDLAKSTSYISNNNAGKPDSKMVRLLMKIGFKSQRAANIFLIIVAVCALLSSGLIFWRLINPASGSESASSDQIPQSVQDHLSPSARNQLQNQ